MDLELPKPNVTFDDDCNLRILNPELRERSTHLADECKLLVSSKWKWMFNCSYKSSHVPHLTLPISPSTEVKEFQSLVASIDTEMNRLLNSKERKKLNATATRLKLEQNSTNRDGEEKELLVSKIEARKKEMEEFSSYIASLEEAERSQLAEIEKLEISSG